MDSLEHIKNTAARWVARRHGSDWTRADEAALSQWLDASLSHRAEYLGHEKTWRDANRLKVLGAGSRLGAIPTLGVLQTSPYFKHLRKDGPRPAAAARARTKLGFFAMAASIFALCIAGYLGWDHLRGPRYSTAIGTITAIPLPDGSKITLNTDSEIRVAVTERERRIELEQGEAYFEVVHDRSRPFVVDAGKKRIVVLGTKFSVRRDGNDVCVIVTEGKVKAGGLLLSAGAVAEARNGQIAVRQRSLPKAEELLSWRDGYLMFDEVTLAEAVAEFNRYNTRKFVIRDSKIASIPVTGHFRSTSVEPFARLLEEGFPVRVTRERERIVLGAR